MAERTERTVLNHLIELCKDGERGFREVVSHLDDPQLKAVFMNLALRRAQFASELLPYAQRLGGPAESGGTTAGALHRSWMRVVELVAPDETRAIIREAERGEGMAEAAYKEALDGMLPPTVRDLVEEQYEELQDSHERVRSLIVH